MSAATEMREQRKNGAYRSTGTDDNSRRQRTVTDWSAGPVRPGLRATNAGEPIRDGTSSPHVP